MFIILLFPTTHKKSANGPSIFDDARQRRGAYNERCIGEMDEHRLHKSAGIEKHVSPSTAELAYVSKTRDALFRKWIRNESRGLLLPSQQRKNIPILYFPSTQETAINRFHCFVVRSRKKKNHANGSRESGSWMGFERQRKRERERFSKNFISPTTV